MATSGSRARRGRGHLAPIAAAVGGVVGAAAGCLSGPTPGWSSVDEPVGSADPGGPTEQPDPETEADLPDESGRPELTPPGTGFVIRGATVVSDGPLGVEAVQTPVQVQGAHVVALGDDVDDSQPSLDLSGYWLAPAVIDSHVHLSYFPVSLEMAQGGVVAAVDLAAPLEEIGQVEGPLRRLDAGPMITPPLGYPTQSWGADGYGWECEGPSACRDAVDELAQAGVHLIKVPLAGPPAHSTDTVVAIVARAHELGLPVAVHALDDAGALVGGQAGADLLAHVPILEPLSEASLALWQARAVVPTIAAFGASPDAIANTAALRERGATILYGTDNGNTKYLGVAEEELDRMLDAGLDPAALLRSCTSGPAAFWGLDDLGTIEVGRRASLLVLEEDPLVDPRTLARPAAVYMDGARVDISSP